MIPTLNDLQWSINKGGSTRTQDLAHSNKRKFDTLHLCVYSPNPAARDKGKPIFAFNPRRILDKHREVHD